MDCFVFRRHHLTISLHLTIPHHLSPSKFEFHIPLHLSPSKFSHHPSPSLTISLPHHPSPSLSPLCTMQFHTGPISRVNKPSHTHTQKNVYDWNATGWEEKREESERKARIGKREKREESENGKREKVRMEKQGLKIHILSDNLDLKIRLCKSGFENHEFEYQHFWPWPLHGPAPALAPAPRGPWALVRGVRVGVPWPGRGAGGWCMTCTSGVCSHAQSNVW